MIPTLRYPPPAPHPPTLAYSGRVDPAELARRILLAHKLARLAGVCCFVLLIFCAVPLAVMIAGEIYQDRTYEITIAYSQDHAFTREVGYLDKRDYVYVWGIWVVKAYIPWLRCLYLCVVPALILGGFAKAAQRYARKVRRPR
jgi:hypothetical protein